MCSKERSRPLLCPLYRAASLLTGPSSSTKPHHHPRLGEANVFQREAIVSFISSRKPAGRVPSAKEHVSKSIHSPDSNSFEELIPSSATRKKQTYSKEERYHSSSYVLYIESCKRTGETRRHAIHQQRYQKRRNAHKEKPQNMEHKTVRVSSVHPPFFLSIQSNDTNSLPTTVDLP